MKSSNCRLRQLFPSFLGLTCSLFVLLCAPTASALDDPALNYHTLTTENFYVHYYDGLEALARRTALVAEESHQVLSPLLDWKPASRTNLLVTDKLDTANGFARVFGRNFITIYGMPPQADSVLGYFEDWLRVLVYHEYVHILHLDTNPGLPQLINRVIGKQLHPNSTMPRWYVEGIAVYLESARTGTGRVDSPLFRMWLRTAALDDRFFTLGQSTGIPIQWPAGSGAYLYGAFFIDYLVRHHGENYIRDFNHEYGRRIIPFAMHHITRQLTDKDLDEHWESFTAEALGEARARQVALTATGQTPLELLTEQGGRNRYPLVRPGSARITFHRSDLTSHPAYAELSPAGGRLQHLLDGEGAAGPAAWSPDGSTLYFSRGTITQNVYSYQDLFAFTPDTGELKQLTRAERAREPALSPDGTQLVYARNRAGSMELALLELGDDTAEPTVLLGRNDWAPDEDGHWQQISRPVFTPDGRGIVFSWWRLDLRQRDLFLYDLNTEEVTRLTRTTSHDMDPHFGPDGLLYFTADVDGIFNIHAMDIETGEVWQVSNVFSGVFSPQVSQDGRFIYVHTYTHQGFEIARFAHPRRLRHADRRATEPLRPRIAWPELGPEAVSEPQPYRPWPWLLPMFFTPDLGVVSGGAGFSATVSGYDPVEHHNYTLSGGFTTGRDWQEQSANLGLSYRYSGGPVSISTLLRFQDYPRTQSLIAESRFIPFIQRQYLGRLSLSYPLRYVGHRFSFSTSYQVEYAAERYRPPIEHEPGDVRPTEPPQGFFNQLSFGLNYARLFRYPHSISTERGVNASVNVGVQHPSLGSQENSVTFSYNLDTFYPNPLIDRHVFAFSARGAVTRSATGPQRLFAIGGHAPQDVLTSIIFQEPRRGALLRGYPPGLLRGGQYQVFKLEYRFPLYDFDRGFSTAPLFVRGLKGAAFADAGAAYDGFFADATLHRGIGAEVQLDAILGYYAANSLRLGYARGLDEGGLSEWYLLFGGSF